MQKTMTQVKIDSLISSAQKNDGFWSAVLVFLATLFLVSTFPFYPIFIVPILALFTGAIAYKMPPIGLIIGFIIGFFAVIYQSSIFGWIYVLVLSLVLFEAFGNWRIISVLAILILAPFALSGFPLIGWIAILGMAISALNFGSKKSLLISLPSVFAILLLSSIWLTENSAYLPLNLKQYQPGFSELQIEKNSVGIMEVVPEIINSIGKFVSPSNMGNIWQSLGIVFGNALKLVISDSLIIQLISWGIALYMVGYLPSKIKTKPQTIAAFSLIVVLGGNFLIGIIFGTLMKFEFIGGIIFAIISLSVLEHFGWNISQESNIQRSDKMKSYGKFGMTDLSFGKEEKSMDDVGGYEDVKKELRDAIMLPLERKEIAFTYGIKPPAGILLFGPPGTGKTMLMRALAKELKYNFIEVKCSQILSQWYGESEKNVAEIFDNARKNSPTVLFFDELDSVARKRTDNSLDTVGPRVLSELLQQIDGANKSKGTVMVVGATNLPNEIDSALLRPGRLDKIIYMHLPDEEARRRIFEVHLKGLPTSEIEYPLLVKKTARFSGADIKNIVVEAKGIAAKEASTVGKIIPITMGHILRIMENIKPSTGIAQLEMYEKFRLDYERRTGGDVPSQPKKKDVSWEEVAGLDDVKDALLESIELPLLHEKEMEQFQVKPSKGILLFGPPGTGKTLIVKAAASELKASFQNLSAADVMKKGFGQAVTIIKETFNRARENTPALIFVDEIETFAPARGMGSSEIIGQFLTEMDGVTGSKGVVVIAATNRPNMMDPAIMRPGRFDKIFYIPPPNSLGRKEIFKIHLGQFASNVDLELLAALTPGFSGADIASVCQAVKMKALKDKIKGKEEKISDDMIKEVIDSRKPSITESLIAEYNLFLKQYGERK